tara:strand:+ start:517 stop:1233 length:717 start_codon:yes stop_codon:yes gene_type:complete
MDNSPKLENVGNSFYEHMFGDKDTKSSLINVIQYSLISVLPVLILNKATQHIFPDADDTKNNLELSVEIVGQLTLLFVGIFFIDRLIRYFKVYSGEKYDDMSLINSIVPFTIILFSIPTKIGQKTKIIMDRILRALNIEKQPENKEEEEKIEIRPTIPIMDVSNMMGQRGLGEIPPALQSVATNPTKEPESVGRVSSSNSNNSNTNTNKNNSENFNTMFEPFASGSTGGSGGLGYTSF